MSNEAKRVEREHCKAVAWDVLQAIAGASGKTIVQHKATADLISRERVAERKDALEEAILAVCFRCRLGIPMVQHGIDAHNWHDNSRNDGVTSRCAGAEIRDLIKALHE
jgi:hypothetical protein